MDCIDKRVSIIIVLETKFREIFYTLPPDLYPNNLIYTDYHRGETPEWNLISNGWL